MSRIGKLPINIPAGVEISIDGNKVTVKGKEGVLTQEVNPSIKLNYDKDKAEITFDIDEEYDPINVSLKQKQAYHGLYRSLIHNMVVGVTEGYEKKLEVNGVGYRAAKQGKKLTLNLGYSHPVEMEDPEGVETVVDGNIITVKGIDKEKVGQLAAVIRDKRRPEPYKGKGIKYADETIRRKVGKTGKK